MRSIWDRDAMLALLDMKGLARHNYDKILRKQYNETQNSTIDRLENFKIPENVSPKIYEIQNDSSVQQMTTKLINTLNSTSGETVKLLIGQQDGHQIETVIMRYKNNACSNSRTSICVSSQIGCAMDCTFCATGTMGIIGSLTCGEIIEQVIWCQKIEPVRNIVFMGMGEPLHNYDAVCTAIDTLIRKDIFSFRHNRVTISTVGIIDKMISMIDTYPDIPLALSLHAPNQELRQKLIPSAQQYPFEQLIQVIDYYIQLTGKSMLIEYILIDNINTSDECIHELGKLFTNRNIILNVIPCNPIADSNNINSTQKQSLSYKSPSSKRIDEICQLLSQEYKIFVTIRKEFGNDIWGACGQLVSLTSNNKKLTSICCDDVEDAYTTTPRELTRRIYPPPNTKCTNN